MSEHPLLRRRWPVLTGQLRRALATAGEWPLAEQVAALEVHPPCDCGEAFCQSFYTAAVPPGPYPAPHRTVVLDDPGWPGELCVDVVAGRICFVEVLFREPLD